VSFLFFFVFFFVFFFFVFFFFVDKSRGTSFRARPPRAIRSCDLSKLLPLPRTLPLSLLKFPPATLTKDLQIDTAL